VKRVFFIVVAGALVATSIAPARPEGGTPSAKRPATPNLVVNVSSALISQAVQRSVDRVEPFEDVILETPVIGIRRTEGTVRMELISDPDKAVMDVVLNGTTHGQSIGFKTLVRLYTCATTPFEVRQRIVLTPHRVVISPLVGWATTEATLLGMVDRDGDPDPAAADFVRAGFRKKKAEGEAEISAKTVQQGTDQLGWESVPSVRSLALTLSRGLRQLKLRGLVLQDLLFRTEADGLQARVRIATPGRTGPDASPLKLANADLSVRIHQSLINEEAQAALGGKTYPLPDLVNQVDRLMETYLRDIREDAARQEALKALKKLLAGLGDKPATITFAKRDPVTIAFGDSAFTVEFNVAALGLAGQSFTGERVRAAYRLEKSGRGIQAVRQGPLQFLPPATPARKGKKMEMPAASLRLFQEAVFGQLLKERLARADLSLPAPFSRLPILTPTQSQTRNGWLQMDWKLSKKTKSQPGTSKG
jgi:hypothetical protein